MYLNVVLLIVGLIILIKGADLLVKGASSIAGIFKISKLFIGFTIVGFMTCSPEMAISIKSMIIGNGEMVFNNVIGSNIYNILLVLGIACLINPIHVKNNTIKKEIPFLLLNTILFSVLFIDNLLDSTIQNHISRTDGIVMMLFFLIFLYYIFTIMKDKKDSDIDQKDFPLYSVSKSLLITGLGLACIIVGGELVVTNCAKFASLVGVSERLVTLLIIVPGTSLPELITSIVSIRKKEYDFMLGNIIGTNMFNLGIVLGIPTAIFGKVVPSTFNYIDIIILLLSVVLLYIFARGDKRIRWWEGIIMLLVFGFYYYNIVFPLF